MTERIKSEVVSVTPEMARNLRQACHFERQRQISEGNVLRLESEIKNDRFVPGTQVYFCVLPDKTMYIVNGNHTLEAVAKSGRTTVLTFTYHRVETLEDVARVYATFDNHKARTWMDTYRAVGFDESVPMVNKIGSAVGFIMSGFRYDTWKPNEAMSSRLARVDQVARYSEEASLLKGAIGGSPKMNLKAITRAPIVAVALETLKYQPSSAVEFWHAVASDEGLSTGDPAKALLRYLQKTGGPSRTYWPELARGCALAWNAHFEGRPLKVIKPGKMPRFRLSGTPWGDEPKAPDLEEPGEETSIKSGVNAKSGEPVITFAG